MHDRQSISSGTIPSTRACPKKGANNAAGARGECDDTLERTLGVVGGTDKVRGDGVGYGGCVLSGEVIE